jgi:hypothetical protein
MSAALKLETGARVSRRRALASLAAAGARVRPSLAWSKRFRRRFSLPEIAARLMAVRGVTLDDAEAFLDADAEDACFPILRRFTDMDEAARVIEDAIVSVAARARCWPIMTSMAAQAARSSCAIFARAGAS